MPTNYTQIFKEKEWQTKFEKDGYIILDGVNESQLSILNSSTFQLIESAKKSLPNRYFPIGQLSDFSIRKKSTAIIEQYLLPVINQHFISKSTAIYSGTHLIKPRGKNSFLSTHQDSALVDETKHNAILAWCPLQNIHLLNGRLYVLKGSHKYGNHHRSTTIPWVFAPFKKEIYKKSTPLKINAGQICYFHSALIHHSGYNFIQPYRVALSAFITDKNATLINCFKSKRTTKKKVEIYETDMEFFHNHDFNEKPPEKYKLLDITEQSLHDINNEFFESLLKTYTENQR